MFELIFSDSASSDLVDIIEYIAKNSVANAHKCRDEILKQLEKLTVEPLIGAPSKIKRLKAMGYRFLVIQSHIAHYQVDESKKHIYIIRILHGAMKQAKHI